MLLLPNGRPGFLGGLLSPTAHPAPFPKLKSTPRFPSVPETRKGQRKKETNHRPFRGEIGGCRDIVDSGYPSMQFYLILYLQIRKADGTGQKRTNSGTVVFDGANYLLPGQDMVT